MIEVELQEHMGSDRSIASAAWTSTYSKNKQSTRSDEDVARVVKLLANEHHGVPFETVIFRFWMKIPIFVDRQLVKHRVASHSGASGRYKTVMDEFLPIPEDVKAILDKFSSEYSSVTLGTQLESVMASANAVYKQIVEQGKKAKEANTITNSEYKRMREIVRGILPQANMTETVFTLNLRSFANFQKLRNSEHAQPEIRELAEKMLELVEQANIAPVAIETLKNNGWDI